jgi:hypothetical protein
MFLMRGEYLERVGQYPVDESAPMGQKFSLDDYPLIRNVIETRQALSTTGDDPRLQEHAREAFKTAGVTANAAIPLVGREGVLGALALSSQQPGQVFGEQDLQVLQTLADQATLAFERIRLLEQTERRAYREQTLREITSHVRGSTNPDVIVRTAVRELGEALGRPTFARLGGFEQLTRQAAVNIGTGPLGQGDESDA